MLLELRVIGHQAISLGGTPAVPSLTTLPKSSMAVGKGTGQGKKCEANSPRPSCSVGARTGFALLRGRLLLALLLPQCCGILC